MESSVGANDSTFEQHSFQRKLQTQVMRIITTLHMRQCFKHHYNVSLSLIFHVPSVVFLKSLFY